MDIDNTPVKFSLSLILLCQTNKICVMRKYNHLVVDGII